MKRYDPWRHVSDDLLDYWLARATVLYAQDIANPKRNKDGSVPKTTTAAIELGARTIAMLDREKRCRKTQTPPKT